MALIRGVHAMFYTPAAEQLRAFFRDKIGFPYTDTGDGWLIFDVSEVEIGCHPARTKFQGISFYCDDLSKTIAELKRRGVEFTSDVREEEWGRVTRFRLPGGDEVELYEPKYKRRHARARRTIRPATRRVRSRR